MSNLRDYDYNRLLIVIDSENNGILCSCTSDSHAYAICHSELNLRWFSLSMQTTDLKCLHQNYNNHNIHFKFTNKNPIPISELEKELITDRWIERRQLIIRKTLELQFWENANKRSVSRVNEYFGMSNLLPFLHSQLEKCDSDRGEYTEAVKEWADIQDVTPDIAYRELVLKTHNYGMTYLRSHALYTKHMWLLARASTIQELEYRIKSSREDLWTKSAL